MKLAVWHNRPLLNLTVTSQERKARQANFPPQEPKTQQQEGPYHEVTHSIRAHPSHVD